MANGEIPEVKKIPSDEAEELDKLHDLYYNQKQGYLSIT